MKVYVVTDCSVIEYEEYTTVMGVFSSKDKAKEAIEVYKEWSKDSRWRHDYTFEEVEVDQIWER